MELLLYASLLTVITIAFNVLAYLGTKSISERGQRICEMSVHAHDDALQRIVADHAWYASQIGTMTRWCDTMTKTINNLAIQNTASAQREIQEVQRYMEVVRQDLIGAVSSAACEGANRTRPMPVAVPPHINPTQRTTLPPPLSANEK